MFSLSITLRCLMFCCLVLMTVRQLAAEESWHRIERTEPRMGTAFRIVVHAQDRGEAERAIGDAFARIDQLDQRLSNYRSDSELMQLCRSAPHQEPVRVSRDLYLVLERAYAVSQQTDGLFDVTVGPLTKLWRRARRRHELPTATQLADARQAVGYQHIRLDPVTSTVQLQRPEMLIDLGGIGKGFALDEALRVLYEHGFRRVLIDGGGDLRVGDAPPNSHGWQIGVADLDGASQGRSLTVVNQAIATSGDLFQFVEFAGVRYSHLVDPRTGMGSTIRTSVTVIAPDGTTADALASAVSLTDPDAVESLVAKFPGCAARVTWLAGNVTRVRETTRFPKSVTADRTD